MSVTGWMKTGYADSTKTQQAINYVKAIGGNTIVLDYAVVFNEDGTITPQSSSDAVTPPSADIANVIALAHQAGLKVFLKPHVTDFSFQNRAFGSNTDASKFSTSAFFHDWQGYLSDLAVFAQARNVEGLVIGTELHDFDYQNRSSWQDLITAVRAKYHGTLTYDGQYWPDTTAFHTARDVVFWDLLDMVGVSFYPPLTSDNNPSLSALLADWRNSSIGNVTDIIGYLADLAKSTGKPLMALEAGYQSKNGALGYWPSTDYVNAVTNYELQDKGWTALLTELQKYSGLINFVGLSAWDLNPNNVFVPNPFSNPWNVNEFGIYGKPAASTVEGFFKSTLNYANFDTAGYHLAWTETTVRAGSANDPIYVDSPREPTATALKLHVVAQGMVSGGVPTAFSIYANGQKLGSGAVQAVDLGLYHDASGYLSPLSTFDFNIPFPSSALADITFKLDSSGAGFLTVSGVDISGIPVDLTASTRPQSVTQANGVSAAGPTVFNPIAVNSKLSAFASQGFVADGGAGIDTLIFDGARSNFSIAQTSTSISILDRTGAEGSVVATQIERLQFADIKVAMDITAGHAGTTAKILGAVFGKATVANPAYAGAGLSLLDGGMTYQDLMKLALDVRLGSGATNTDVVNLLYNNVVGTVPSASELGVFVGLLDNGTYTRASLGVLAAETSLNAVNVDLVGLNNSGLAYA